MALVLVGMKMTTQTQNYIGKERQISYGENFGKADIVLVPIRSTHGT